MAYLAVEEPLHLGHKRGIILKIKEPGTMIDQMAGVLTLIFMMATLLAYIGVGKTIAVRFRVDNIAKKYLYQMEQTGYLSATDRGNMENELRDACGNTEAGWFTLDPSTTTHKAEYGEPVNLKFTVNIKNPLYDHFGGGAKTGSWFKVDTISNPTIPYTVDISSVARQ